MTGYHFTSFENWLHIREDGLQPYLIDKEEFHACGLGKIQGVWTWRNKLKGQSYFGTALLQMSRKLTTHVVEMEYTYEDSDEYKAPGNRNVRIFHEGRLVGVPSGVIYYLYHAAEEAVILKNPVAPDRINLIRILTAKDFIKDVKNSQSDAKLLLPYVERVFAEMVAERPELKDIWQESPLTLMTPSGKLGLELTKMGTKLETKSLITI